MTLYQKINNDLIEAVKLKDETKVSTLRLLKSAIHNWQIANQKEPQENEIISLIQKEIKSRRDAMAIYKQGGREELAKKEEGEILILQKYLPEQMSPDEIKAKVEEVIVKTQAKSPQDIGKVMGILISELKNKAEPGVVAQMVKEKLLS